MGSRTSEVLKEIEDIRSRMDGRLDELEYRLPPLAKAGKRALAVALSGGAGAGGLLLLARRRRSKRRSSEPEPRVVAAPVTVKVLPGGTLPVAMVGLAIWAGVRLVEARSRRGRSV